MSNEFDVDTPMPNLFKEERLPNEPDHHVYPPGVLERIHENIRLEEEERQRSNRRTNL